MSNAIASTFCGWCGERLKRPGYIHPPSQCPARRQLPEAGAEDMAARIGANIRRARDASLLTQEQLAQRAGLHPSAISLFENGRQRPSAVNIIRVCLALHCSADVILGIPDHRKQVRE